MARWQDAPVAPEQQANAPRWASAPVAEPPRPRQGAFRNALNAFNDALLPDFVMDAAGPELLPRPDPQTQGERIAASAGNMLGMAAPALLGVAGLARAVPGIAAGASPAATGTGEAVAQSVLEGFRSAPAANAAAEAAAALGAGAGGQVAREAAPGSPTTEFVGELAGGIAPAALANAPVALATRAAGSIMRRVAPEATARRAREVIGETIGDQLTPDAQRNLATSEEVRQQVPGLNPSLAEATDAPALVATQRAVESQAQGADLERYAGRYQQNAAAVDRFAQQNAPTGPEADAVADAARRRVDGATGKVAQAQAGTAAKREDLASGITVVDRSEVGARLRDGVKAERDKTRKEMNALAQELGINDADVSMEFGPARAEIEALFTPKSVLEDESKIPGAVSVLKRLDVPASPLLGPNGKPLQSGKGTAPVTFKDLRLYRERIGDDLRDAQSSATPNRALIRNLTALRKKVDDAVDALAESADPALAEKYKQFRSAYYDRYVTRFERGAVSKVNAKDGSGFYRTADEKVAEAFFTPGNLTAARQFKSVFGDSPEAAADLEAAALDSLRSAAVRDGVVDERAFTTWKRQHQSVLDEFPGIAGKVDSLGNANAALIQRQQTLAGRQRQIEDTLLARELQAIDRGTKTPDQLIDAALKNPAKMTQVLDTVRRRPDAMAGLRRALWGRATTGSAEDTATFMAQHEQTLKQALTPEHWENLVVLQKARAIIERVGPPRGKGVSPDPLKKVQDAIGMGVNQLASRIFAAESGRTSWRYITVDALSRFLRGRSQAETAALFNQALYDPRVARGLAELSVKADLPPIAQKKLNAWLWQAGLTTEGEPEQQPQ